MIFVFLPDFHVEDQTSWESVFALLMFCICNHNPFNGTYGLWRGNAVVSSATNGRFHSDAQNFQQLPVASVSFSSSARPLAFFSSPLLSFPFCFSFFLFFLLTTPFWFFTYGFFSVEFNSLWRIKNFRLVKNFV